MYLKVNDETSVISFSPQAAPDLTRLASPLAGSRLILFDKRSHSSAAAARYTVNKEIKRVT